MSISINNLLSQFRAQLPILTTLPEVVPAGAEFYYNGTKWRGLGAGETSLPEGTPWPVKGYKEVSGYLVIDGNGNMDLDVVINDLGDFSISVQTNEDIALLFTNIPFSLTEAIYTFGTFVDDSDDTPFIQGGVESQGAITFSCNIGDTTVAYNPGGNPVFVSIPIYPPQP